MLFRSQLLCTLVSLIWTGTVGASDTSYRELWAEVDPLYPQVEKLLEIAKLPAKPGNLALRTWDVRSSTTVRVEGYRTTVDIIWGHGEAWYDLAAKHDSRSPQSNNPALSLEAKKHRFEFSDAALAKDIEYLLSRINEFRSTDRGLDGGTTCVDAVDAAGTFSTFELWSPNDSKGPLAAELCHLHWTFVDCVRLTTASDEDWKSHEKTNFMTRFSGTSGIHLTQEKARVIAGEGLKKRLRNLVAELKRIPIR